jgi:hypothetical protein
VAAPPLVLTMVRLPLGVMGKMENSPAMLSVSPGAPAWVIA